MPIDRARLKQLFGAALSLPQHDRPAFIAEHCADDDRLRAELESLLRSHDRAGDFLERPPTVGGVLREFTPSAHAPQIQPGQRLGPYEILACLGAGGMGEVHRARDVRLDRIVALKVLYRTDTEDEDARAHFEHEARAISKINHPNICALYDIGRHDDVEFLVMEYLEGETLTARLERGPMDQNELVRHASEIAVALARAHRHGVIHRDLKPSNIVLTESGAKLLDFGIAKLQGPERDAAGASTAAPRTLTATRRGRIVGTVAYMSPEQLRGTDVDARSDLFSFGAVLYEMATGRRAFAGSGATAVKSAILEGHVTPVQEVNPSLDPELCRVIHRALERDRTQRYQSAADLSADLRRVADLVGAGPRVRFWTRRRFAAAAAAAIAAVVSGLLALSAARSSKPPETGRSMAVLPFKPLAGTAANDDEYLGVALADALINELNAVHSIAVRPLSASTRYGPDRDAIAAGRELDADLVLDGALERAGDRVHVIVSLLRVRDRATLWSDRFDLPWADIFRVQDAIADQVTRALTTAPSGEERQRIARRRTANVDAYEAYLKGRYFWNMRTPDGFQRALDYFQRAIDVDPNYAPAYAGLADTYALLGSMPYAVMPPSEAGTKAKAAAVKALSIDPTLAEAEVSLAFVTYSFEWDWPRGEAGFKRAIALDSDYAPAHYWYSLFLGQTGRVEEALAQAQRAQELEPLSLVGTYAVGLAHFYARRMQPAAAFAEKTLEIAPAFPPGLRLLGSVRVAEGRPVDGITHLRRVHELAPDNTLHTALLSYAYGRAGRRVEAEAMVAGLITDARTRFVPAAHIAMAYVGLERRDEIFRWFEKAYQERSQALTFLKIDPMFDSLRSDPRFLDLVRRVGLAR
jgi:TolB-like protein/tRNA A-37 threonylcarbamoyl transferase component Bud32/Tfp pilus assembly protein PilF/DNA-binding transcriptional regulator YdaS (Cro superfamily)